MIGLWINVHYCMGMVETVDVLHEQETCCCPMETPAQPSEKDCCEDEIIVLQMDQEATLSLVSSDLRVPISSLTYNSPEYNVIPFDTQEAFIPEGNNTNVPILKRAILLKQSLIFYS